MDLIPLLNARFQLIHAPALDRMRTTLASAGNHPRAVRDRNLPPMDGSDTDGLGRPTVRKSGGVAIVSATGPLYHDEGALLDEFLALIFGGTSYDAIANGVKAAVEDRAVEAIVLYVNSPGGEVSGCAETASIIKAAAVKKPIVAYVSFMGCSAAYWLASACGTISCNATSILGSIGVRASCFDDSEALAKAGYKQFDFVAKQSPHKIADPKTEKGRQQIQAEIDALGEVFVQTVAKNRGVSVAKVLSDFGGGGVLVGKEAVKVGLADELNSLGPILKTVNGGRSAKPARKNASAATARPVAAQPSAQDIHMSAIMDEINASAELKHRFTRAANSPSIANGTVNLDQLQIEPGITARGLVEKIEQAVAVADAPALFEKYYKDDVPAASLSAEEAQALYQKHYVG